MAAPKGFLVVPIGENPDGDLRMLELDADDNLKVALAGAAQGLVGTHGWIAGAWQKDPLRFGYSGTVVLSASDTNLGAGANDVDLTTVPAGELQVITNIVWEYTGTTPTEVEVSLYDGSTAYPLFTVSNPITTEWYDKQGFWVVPPTGFIRCSIVGATAGDDLQLRATGFRVDLDQ